MSRATNKSPVLILTWAEHPAYGCASGGDQ
jgi:hypothetical protein